MKNFSLCLLMILFTCVQASPARAQGAVSADAACTPAVRMDSAPELDARLEASMVHHSTDVPLLTQFFSSTTSADTTAPVPQTTQGSVPQSNTQSSSTKMSKSPGGALVRSLVCPGWGQLYNESYWKSALFFGASATVTGILLWNNAKFLNANTTFSTPGITDLQKDQAYREREFYRDQRDVSGLWLLGIYTLSAIDAYVGAHLYDFDVSDKGISAAPAVNPNMLGVNVCMRF